MSEKIELTPGEKLILLMLCDIQKHLKMKGDVDPALVEEAITSGNLWGLNTAFTGIFHGHETSQAIVDETARILTMWERLEQSYNALAKDDKKKVPDGPGVHAGKLSFPGFGDNFEAEYSNAMDFYVNHLDRFQHFKGRTRLNAHLPMLDTYRRMLAVFEPILYRVLNLDFAAEQIAQVMAEAIHPEQRKNV